MKHKPTPHARRVAALRYQAERLLRDAEAWGCEVRIVGPVGGPCRISVYRNDDEPSRPDTPRPAAPADQR